MKKDAYLNRSEKTGWSGSTSEECATGGPARDRLETHSIFRGSGVS